MTLERFMCRAYASSCHKLGLPSRVWRSTGYFYYAAWIDGLRKRNGKWVQVFPSQWPKQGMFP